MTRSTLSHNFHPSVLVPAITAGLIAGILAIILQLSFAALVFGGDLSPYLGRGIGLALFSGIVLAFVVAVTSSFQVSIASPQDSPAAILAIITVSLSALLSESRDTSATFATVIAALAATTLLTGAVFFGLGIFRLGRLVRFIPYPVVGGFLAGTGWLLLEGGINVMTGARLTPEWAFLLSQPIVIVRWLPGVALACVLLIVLRRWTHALITPAILFIAILLFYAALVYSGNSVDTARERSWMLGPFPSESLFQFLTPMAFADANWTILLRQADKIAATVVVCVVALLLNASGIELAVRRDLDFNRELRAAGVANFIAGIAAGFPGYHLLGASTLSYRLGARSRITGIAAAVLVAFTLLFGADLLEYVPRPVLGALLVYLGIAFLVEWLYDAFFKLPRLDYALIVLITAVIAIFGFLPGVGVGIVVAMLLFIVTYSRVRSVKQELTGATYRSTVDRSPAERALMLERGGEIWILQLQEFVFFGTAQTLLDKIRARIEDTSRDALRYIILDFQRVPGLDSSAVASFLRMQQLLEQRNIVLGLTGVTSTIQQQLKRGGLKKGVHLFPTLDAGVEWCEDQILADSGFKYDDTFSSLDMQLQQILPRNEDVERIQPYMARLEVPAGTYLIRQGEMANAVYFIEQGEVSVEAELEGGKTMRLRTIQHSSVVGEIATYWGGVRTASVVTVKPTTVYRITTRELEEMDRKDPDLAAAMHRWMATVMAERLAENTKMIRVLMN
jgi:SulP family sulfate permease